MPNAIPTFLPEAGLEWRRPFIDWRVSHEGQLEAIAHTLKDEQVWRLVCDLMESALQTGWEARDALPEPEPLSVR